MALIYSIFYTLYIASMFLAYFYPWYITLVYFGCFCNTSPEGGYYLPRFLLILMILILVDGYGPPLSIDTKYVPVSPHLTSQ